MAARRVAPTAFAQAAHVLGYAPVIAAGGNALSTWRRMVLFFLCVFVWSMLTANSLATPCPCDAVGPEHAERATHEGGSDSAASTHDACDHNTPYDERCPSDCPDCCCCARTAIAAAPLEIPTVGASTLQIESILAPVAPPQGARSSVYRPPRLLV